MTSYEVLNHTDLNDTTIITVAQYRNGVRRVYTVVSNADGSDLVTDPQGNIHDASGDSINNMPTEVQAVIECVCRTF